MGRFSKTSLNIGRAIGVRISNPGGVAGEGPDHVIQGRHKFVPLDTYPELDGIARKPSYMPGARLPFEPSSEVPIDHQDRHYFLWPFFSVLQSSGLSLSNLVLFGAFETPNP